MSKQKSNKADCKKIYFKGYGQPEGSVTVEAAVIIPIMLAFIYLVASFGLFSADLSQKYTQTVRLAEKTSVAAYLVKNG